MAKQSKPNNNNAEYLKQIEVANSYWGNNRQKFRFNIDFVLGHQWESAGASWRGRSRNTRLTFNMLYPYIKNIMGEQLQNTPDVTVKAGSKDVEQWEIDLTEGILRGIHYDSDLPNKTYKVFFNQLAGGYGAYLVKPEYECGMSFTQVIKIYQKEDPTLCYWDENASDDCKIHGDYCGFYVPIPKKNFDEDFPEAKGKSGFGWSVVGLSQTLYSSPNDYVVIAEHWVKEYKTATIYQLDDGRTCTKDEYEPLLDDIESKYLKEMYVATLNGQPAPPKPIPPKIINQKRDKIFKIKYIKLIPGQNLEEKDWPGNLLPLAYADGDSYLRRGRQEIKSFTDFAHDSQRAYNYVKNQIVQQIKNFRREQWIGTPEMVQGKGIQEMWRNPEEQAGILLAKRDETGQLPQKTPPSQISPDLMTMQQYLTSDIENILGRHAASQGAAGGEPSGVALLHRIVQDNLGSFTQLNNLCKAMIAVDEICLDMIPAIYDSERDVITRNKDNEPQVVKINEFSGLSTNEDGTYDAETTYYKNQIARKKMRVELSAGPMFSAQKQIEFNKLIQVAQLMPPELVPALLDMIGSNVDLPNTNQLVKRLKAFVPKPILAQSGELNPEEMQQLQEQMAQQSQQVPPQMQLEMQKLQIEQQRVKMQQDEIAQRSQNQEVENYLNGLKTQVQLAEIQSSNQSDQIGLQKDLIKANAELKTAAMNALHQMHKTNLAALSAPTRQGYDGNNTHTGG